MFAGRSTQTDGVIGQGTVTYQRRLTTDRRLPSTFFFFAVVVLCSCVCVCVGYRWGVGGGLVNPMSDDQGRPLSAGERNASSGRSACGRVAAGGAPVDEPPTSVGPLWPGRQRRPNGRSAPAALGDRVFFGLGFRLGFRSASFFLARLD